MSYGHKFRPYQRYDWVGYSVSAVLVVVLWNWWEPILLTAIGVGVVYFLYKAGK